MMQKKHEDGELGSSRELKTTRYQTNQGLGFTGCSARAIDCAMAPVRPVQATANIKQLAGSTPTRGRAV